MNIKTIAVFGSTGKTGQFFIPAALERGYKVRALARNPNKIAASLHGNKNLEVIKGDFEDVQAIQDTVQGANHVVSMAGGPVDRKAYPRLFIHKFMERLLPILEREAEADLKTFVYTGNMFVPLPPNGKLPWPIAFAKPILGLVAPDMGPIQEDHDTDVYYLSNNLSTSYKTIFLRPGFLTDNKFVNKPMVVSDTPYFTGTIGFQDLALFILDVAMADGSLEGKYAFVKPAPK